MKNMPVGLFENRCPNCGEEPILEFFLKTKPCCENCDYVFFKESGAFTGPLYLNMSVMGVATFPVVPIFLLTGASVLSVAAAVAFELICLSPFTLRFSKLFWIHMDYRERKKSAA